MDMKGSGKMQKLYYSEEKQIRIYHTHIEISPYTPGESERIERLLSIWIDAEYRYEPIGYYVSNNILYIPRGISSFLLENIFNSTPFIMTKPDKMKHVRGVKMLFPPRDRIQTESIEFLSSDGDFKNTRSSSQQALILDTGDGKTYATIHAIINLGMKAIIITHQDKIKNQWIQEFLTKTTVSEDMLINIDGSEVIEKIMKERYPKGYYYFVNHQSLSSYARLHGWEAVRRFFKKIEVGIKVFDEAHLAFKNVLRVDFFSNTMKTFYLTANFGRSDTQEGYLFKKAFSSVYKFGEQTKNYEEKRKHIIYVPVLYRSSPNANQLAMASSRYGFSVLGFSKYALHDDSERKQLHIFLDVLNLAMHYEGKILVTTPRIDDTFYLEEEIKDSMDTEDLFISTINSRNTKQHNEDVKQNADIICSTIKSCGTGVNIKNLRCIINLEPFSSDITANQLAGRLREYAPDKDTYFFDLIDLSFSSCERQYKNKLSYLKKKCKEIQILKEDKLRLILQTL